VAAARQPNCASWKDCQD